MNPKSRTTGYVFILHGLVLMVLDVPFMIYVGTAVVITFSSHEVAGVTARVLW